jgi:hypothetical protein
MELFSCMDQDEKEEEKKMKSEERKWKNENVEKNQTDQDLWKKSQSAVLPKLYIRAHEVIGLESRESLRPFLTHLAKSVSVLLDPSTKKLL